VFDLRLLSLDAADAMDFDQIDYACARAVDWLKRKKRMN
jgi:hypothetical protein